MRQDYVSGRAQFFHLAVVAAVLLPQILVVGCAGNRRSGPVLNRPLERGIASWYGPQFHGRRTASGERYDMHDLTAAHPTLPFGTRLEVRNVQNGRSVVVRVNDRGPFAKRRVIDLSYAAAEAIGVVRPGTASVEIYLAGARGSQIGVAPPRYTVQVGAFSETEKAVELRGELARMYPEAAVHSDGTWNRVQIGAFVDRQQAESLRRELAVLGMESFVVAAQ
ncbi:MAG TPA: septal ring lytic transglycosylase RlpA family protein [Thermoanaerobaculia bacterium]|nr:septal ring lytic transglycosylase RlpA family protein [Thermoanaerobaculia bacterium]